MKAQVLEVDLEKRRIKLGMKQLIPTSVEEYIAERKLGDVVSGRVVEVSNGQARVELGEGIYGTSRIPDAAAPHKPEKKAQGSAPDLSSLTSMLQAHWKSGTDVSSKVEGLQSGQIRSFRVTKLDPAAKQIALELA